MCKIKASPDDAFVAPWRTVDRETFELREELLKAQREATAFDQRQLEEEEAGVSDDTAKTADIGGAVASAASGPPAPGGQSSYESVFATARKLAERRATGIVVAEEASAKGKEPDRALSVATFDDEDEDGEDDNDFEPRDAEDEDDEEEVLQLDMEPIDETEEVTSPAASANEYSSIATSSAASPSNSQAIAPARSSPGPESEPASELSEPASELSEPASELSVASDASDQSIELSVVEESSGDESDGTSESNQDQTQDDEEDDEEKAGAEDDVEEEVALPASIEEPEEPELPSESEAAEESEQESDQVKVAVESLEEDEEESAGLDHQDATEETDEAGASSIEDASDVGSVDDDSDHMTEEIATMSSEEHEEASESGVEAEPEVAVSEVAETEAEESAAESADSTAAVRASESSPLSSPRSWWPFSGRSFLGGLGSAQKDQPRKRPQAVHETASESDDSTRVRPTKRKSEELLAIDNSRDQASLAPPYPGPSAFAKRRMPQRTIYGRSASPYVPLSFIDVSNNGTAAALGKRVRRTEYSELRNGATAVNRRQTSNVLEPAATPSELSKVAASYEPLSISPKRAKIATLTPAITAASLGLEARRSVARGRCQQLRRLTSVYYGSGYGSHSAPYTINVSLSAPKVVSAKSTQVGSAQEANPVGDGAGARGGSITAQTILDIISEVPPICSLANMDSHDIINPYELSSPYSVRMRPATAQRRRVLVPLSTRLSQSPANVSTKAAAKHTDNSGSARAVIESIQSAAPPEVQAGLGSALQPIQPNRQTPKRFLPPPLPTKKLTTASSPSVTKSAGAAVLPSQSPSVASPSSITKTLSSTSPSSLAARLAAKGLPAPKPLDQLTKDTTAEPVSLAPKQALSSDVPKSLPKAAVVEGKASTPLLPPPAKSLFSTPLPTLASKAVDVPPPKTRETVAAPAARQAPSATTTALAMSEVQLPEFSFALPTTSQPVSNAAAKQKAESLGASQLPAFAFTLDVKAMPTKGFSQLSTRLVQPLAQAKTDEWTCDVCDLKSPASAAQCVVCDAARPTSKPAAAPSAPPAVNLWASSGLNPVGPANGEWVCDTCELKNPSSASKCTVCDAAKPGPAVPASVAAATAATTVAPVPNLWAQSGFSIAGPANGEWTCDTCELRNPSSASKCTVCDAAKPGTTIPSSIIVATVATAAPVPNLWAQSMFNVAGSTKGEWTCDTCELKNPSSASKCTVCDAAKPGPAVPASAVATAATTVAPVPNLWAQSGFSVAGPTNGEWTCDTCELKNPSSAPKCTVCDAAKSGQSLDAPPSSSAMPSAKKRASDLDASQLPVFTFDLDVSKRPNFPRSS
ncbi:hypothetical protein IWW39_005921 [Coemansia spiralis]|uniref:RanBP2-type domain-containing protein n=1 Tax=Coemansia spiralis TaxID=417178 RepID=A0A9W8GEB3_9FUNG|nr:hypothetical protein IWW39_005921 [Coemansia spiralis]